MKKVLFICFMLLLAAHYVHCQTTNFSFSSLSFSSTDLKNPNRGFETWMGSNTAWANNANGVKLPTSSDVRGYNYYKRINWAQIENAGSGTTPASPRYDFDFLFDNLVKSCIDNGQMFSFGILNVAPGYNAAGGASKDYGTPGGKNLCYPVWLHNAMQAEATKDVLYTDDWVPDWNSDTYLTALDSLNNAIAAHIAATSYTPAGGPWAGISVPFSKVIFCVDIRGYGQSGEWNMSGYTPTGGGFAIDYEIAQGRHPTANTLKRMINSHKNAFPDYYLVTMTDGLDTDAGNSSVIPDSAVYFLLNYSNNKGRFGWRRDNWANDQSGKLESNPLVMGGWHADTAISNRWKYAPVTGEPYAGSYTGMGGSPYANMPEEAKRYHASLIGNGNFYTYSAQMGDSIIKASKWLGYRLEPISGYMTTTLTQNQNFTVSNTWRNSGIAPVYLPTKIKYELRTNADALLATWTSAFSPTKFLPGDSTVTETFNLGNVATGTTHKLNVIFVDSLGYAIPIKLALTSPSQNGDGSYTLRSNITVQDAGVLPGKIRLRKL